MTTVMLTGRLGREETEREKLGKHELVLLDIDDPVSGKRRAAVMNVRESTLDSMRTRGTLTDIQLEAGNLFRQFYERSIVGAAKAIDYSKIRVDCGSVRGDPITSSSMRAREELKRVRERVGKRGFWLLKKIAGDGMTLDAVATVLADGGSKAAIDRKRAYVRERLIEALDDLVAATGIKGKGAKPQAEAYDGPLDFNEWRAEDGQMEPVVPRSAARLATATGPDG